VYGKYLDERNVWYLGIPVENYRDPVAISGGPAIGSGTMFAAERRRITVPDAFNPGTTQNSTISTGTRRGTACSAANGSENLGARLELRRARQGASTR
jgi:hypothetical protein